MKIVITSNTPQDLHVSIKEKKLNKPLATRKEEEYCAIHTDDNSSINNHFIDNKRSNSDNNNNNDNNGHTNNKVNNNKDMNATNNDCKINDNKSNNNNNNPDIENNISNNIDNKYDRNSKDNNIYNQSKGNKISRYCRDYNTSIIDTDNNTKEVNIKVSYGSNNISNKYINNGNKRTSIIRNTTNSQNKTYHTKKPAFIIGASMIKNIDGYEFRQSQIYCQSKTFPFSKDS